MTDKGKKANFVKLCARIVRREFLPNLENCRTIRDARREVVRMDDRHGWLGLELMRLASEAEEGK